MEELLTSYLRFLDEEIYGETCFDPDVPIKNQFGAVLDELDFRLATVKFEMDSLVEIPMNAISGETTLRELIEKVAAQPKIGKAEAPAFLKKKKDDLTKIARLMAEDLQSMLG
ncbi:MAG TPA: hypothetical protein PLM07_08505 [Candidatus Rifleibacterium sp.]|nr:hypothetical protein [Candidatus Rifleibacterium sp.]HPT45924.1 hypothetical protein [Candidatus Rifleibacterium sp.]